MGAWCFSQVVGDYQIIYVNYVNCQLCQVCQKCQLSIQLFKRLIGHNHTQLNQLYIKFTKNSGHWTQNMIQVLIYHIVFFILTRGFPLWFYIGAILLENFFVSVLKNASLSKSVLNLVKMSIFLCPLAICQVSSIFVADDG